MGRALLILTLALYAAAAVADPVEVRSEDEVPLEELWIEDHEIQIAPQDWHPVDFQPIPQDQRPLPVEEIAPPQVVDEISALFWVRSAGLAEPHRLPPAVLQQLTAAIETLPGITPVTGDMADMRIDYSEQTNDATGRVTWNVQLFQLRCQAPALGEKSTETEGDGTCASNRYVRSTLGEMRGVAATQEKAVKDFVTRLRTAIVNAEAEAGDR